MAAGSKIHFFFNVPVVLSGRAQLKAFIEDLFRKERKKLEGLNYIFCSDEELLLLNREYLKHDFYTDILSFDLSQDLSGINGEIYISVDRVQENAKKHKVPLKEELLRVILHGALHLCGYEDKTAGEIKEMRKREEKYLRLYLR